MNTVLLDILKANAVHDEQEGVIPLHSAISIEEAEFIHNTIRSNNLTRAVEVGCAMGISSIAIENALCRSENSCHYIIDPNQQSQWKNMGVRNLKRAGFDNFKLIEDYSELALPELVRQGLKFNLGFIDGWHTFDHTLVDFFYINRLLEVNGIVIIDDVHMTGINKVIRYIYNYPCYEYVGKVENKERTNKRKLYEKAATVLTLPRHLMGTKASEELYNSRVLRSDRELNLDATMIAFRKTADDQRPWNWYENF